MGCFSFTDCASKGRIRFYEKCCILVPNEFVYFYGVDGKIKESSYDGYGNFGGCDVYEFLAMVNRKYLSVDKYDKCDFKLVGKECFSDFIKGVSDAEMNKKYGSDWLRSIGIDLFSSYPRLHYPLKVTKNLGDGITYESVKGKSKDDKHQGCW